jgi:hypothetical protein
MRAACQLLVVLGSVGCVGGGGPVVGCPLGDGRCFVGAELGAGLPVAQASVGVQSGPATVYGRLDGTWDVVGLINGRDPNHTPGGRIGVGVSSAEHPFVFEAGGHVDVVARMNGIGHGCSEPVPVALVGIDLRYIHRQWFVAFAPRVEVHSTICEH